MSGEGAPNEKKGWFARLKAGVSRTSNALSDNLTGVLTKRKLAHHVYSSSSKREYFICTHKENTCFGR